MTATPVRPFTDADALAWVALSNLVLDRTVTVEAFRTGEARRDPQQLNRRWVAERGGEVQGLAHLSFFPFDPPGFLHASVLVHPEARGKAETALAVSAISAAARGSDRERRAIVGVPDQWRDHTQIALSPRSAARLHLCVHVSV